MKKILFAALAFSAVASCNDGSDFTVAHFRPSYDELRKQYPDDVIIQDKIMYDTFWVVGGDFIEYNQFDFDDPKKIVHTHLVNDIQTDEDYRIPLNSTLYNDPKFDGGAEKDSVK